MDKFERFALLKVRTTDRMRPPFPKASPREAQEEQEASSIRVPRNVFSDLRARGLIEFWNGGCLRLTVKGRAALQPKPGGEM